MNNGQWIMNNGQTVANTSVLNYASYMHTYLSTKYG